jgi:DNA-binding transcriptional regulator/RsmH inhibitor MraZ
LARFRQRLRNLPELSAEAEELKSTMQGWTFKTDTDKQYRIKLNPELCKIAELSAGQQITAVGRGDFLEIWEKDEWDTRSRENLKSFAAKLKNARQSS